MKTPEIKIGQTIALVVAAMLVAGFLGTTGLTAAIATTSDPNNTRMVWHTARCSNQTSCDNLKDETLSALGAKELLSTTGQKDTLIFHFGSGQDPQSYQISAMQSVNSMDNVRKGFEFFSLAEIEEHLPTLDAANFNIIAYDLEGSIGNGPSPDAELSDPVQAFQDARTLVDDYNTANSENIELMAVPSRAITNSHAADIAEEVQWYHIQSQPNQDDDTNCSTMETFVDNMTSNIEGAKAGLEDEITAQVTITGNAASGKTAYETAVDCIDAIIGNDMDGFTVWWGGTQFDNDEFLDIYTYLETLG